MEYQVHSLVVGSLQENTYIVSNQQNEALIIDPGAESDKLIDWIDSLGVSPIAILITHCHSDHVGAVIPLKEHYQIEDYIPAGEIVMYYEYTSSHTGTMHEPDHQWEENAKCQIGGFEFDVRQVPGHSPDHVIYVFNQGEFAISGDTVFKGTIGRTDLPGSSSFDLMYYIGQEIITLPDDCILYPGHGPATTVQEEWLHNPFFEIYHDNPKFNR